MKDVQEICPDRMDHQLRNPAGMVARGGLSPRNFKRFIGVPCIPIGMKMFIYRRAAAEPEAMSADIKPVGLNRTVFVRRAG